MTKVERTIGFGFVAVVASGILLFSYATHWSASAQQSGCATESDKLSQTLDQVRFATSAERAIASAVAYSDESRQAYYQQIKDMRSKLVLSNNVQAQSDLVQASVILSNQESPIERAKAIAAEAKSELRSGLSLISEASSVEHDGDCRALSLTIGRSGWPKDHLLAQLAMAAHLNAQINDQLNNALALITQAQKLVR